MEITGSRIVCASRVAVWAHLTSAESLAFCIPGCEHVTGSPEAGFDMVVRRKVGVFTLHFAGTIALSDVIPGESVTLTGRGKGGVAGFAEGSARIWLSDRDGGTELAWDLGALLDGRVARLGHRPLRAVVTAMTDRFADRLEDLLRQDAGTDTE